MSAAEFTEAVRAVGLPGAILIIMGVYVLRNGGIKFIFRDEIRDDLGDIKKVIEGLSDEIHAMKTEIAVMKALYDKEKK